MPIKDNKLVILSYSSFNVYSLCPSWYFREKVKREPTPEEDSSYNVPGLITHHAAERYLKDGNEDVFNPLVIQKAVANYSQKPKVDLVSAYGSIEKATDFTLKCVENMQRFLFSRELLSKKNFLCEQWFGSWDDPLMLSDNLATQGAADLIELNDNGTAILYDYKATWSTKNLNKDQLILYSIASEKRFGRPITMSSFFLIPQYKHNYFNFTDADKRGLVERMQTAADSILAGNFPTTPNKKCDRCPFFSSCQDAGKYKSEIPEVKTPEAPTNFSFPSFGDIKL